MRLCGFEFGGGRAREKREREREREESGDVLVAAGCDEEDADFSAAWHWVPFLVGGGRWRWVDGCALACCDTVQVVVALEAEAD